MSHNSLKISGKEPAVNGDVLLGVADLSDVTGTPTLGQSLQWDGSNWVPATVGGSASYSYALYGRGESDDYSNYGVTPSAGNTWGFYDSSPHNSISSSVTFNTSSGWLTSITLAAGKYVLTAGTGCVFSSTGYLALTLKNTSTATYYGATASIGANVSTYGAASGVVHATIDTASSITIGVYITAVSGLSATQGNTPSEQGFLLIQQVN